ncbi:hypothetical protein BN1708_004529 [Verticillium longisporum]|uniref:Zn(2)-C6 fungal-type domain-containing protein n=1 Tax=Verticillium longisporum TaxID=100787 RepID=A0A0G4M1D7_VERLO|nr:hypothetical protein BN1708_004529 [Verticillium longisporum]
MSARPGACHNCRRSRLRCYRYLPRCLKRTKAGHTCLGYGTLLRWEKGMASRGKMVGVTSDSMLKIQKATTTSSLPAPSPAILSTEQAPLASSHSNSPRSLPRSLEDPSAQDLDFRSRTHLDYFARVVCKDLVLYDTPQHNPFRDLVPMAYQKPILFQAITATSALRMSNACRQLSRSSSMSASTDSPPKSSTRSPSSRSIGPCLASRPKILHDALSAKQQALLLLKSALETMAPADVDAILASVLLLIGFELIDSGRGSWIFHINGARTIIEKLIASAVATETTLSPLRRWLMSNCLRWVIDDYHVTASGCRRQSLLVISGSPPSCIAGRGSALKDERRLYVSGYLGRFATIRCLTSLTCCKSFDPAVWAINLQPRSPADDLFHRTEIASAHKAAVCVYLSRIILALWPSTALPDDLETLAAEIIVHLSCMQPRDALFTATAWPAFIAGLETADLTNRAWVVRRFQELWELEAWGLTREALGALTTIWDERKNKNTTESGNNMLDLQEENWN